MDSRFSETDAEWSRLAALAAQGNQRALEQLCRKLLPRVRNLVRYLVRGERDVDDRSQEAMLLILRGIATYRGEGAFRSWCDRIVARSVFSALSRQKRQLSAEALPEGGSREPEAPEERGGTSYIERRRLVAQLDRLPLEQRAALVCHHVLGMTAKEVAVDHQVSLETVRSRLKLGRQRLRDLARGPRSRKVG